MCWFVGQNVVLVCSVFILPLDSVWLLFCAYGSTFPIIPLMSVCCKLCTFGFAVNLSLKKIILLCNFCCAKRESNSYDHMHVSRGYMRAQHPLLMAPKKKYRGVRLFGTCVNRKNITRWYDFFCARSHLKKQCTIVRFFLYSRLLQK